MNELEKRQKSAIRFIKQVQDHRSIYKGYFIQKDKQCFCDGFMAIILDDFIDGINKAEDTNARINLSETAFKNRIFNKINLNNAEKIKATSGIFLKINNHYFLSKSINIIKGILGKNIKAYISIGIDSEIEIEDEVLFLENENGKAVLLCTRERLIKNK